MNTLPGTVRPRQHRRSIRILLLLFALFAARSGWSLESFKFVEQHKLNLKEPLAFARLGDGRFVVYEYATHALLFLDADHNETARVSMRDAFGSDYSALTALTVNPALKQVFTLDARRRNIFIFDLQGAHLRTLDLGISGPTTVSRPTCMAIDASGRVYVGDSGRGDIKVFSLQGMYLLSLHRPPDSEGRVAPIRAVAVAVLHDGRVAALETEGRELLLFARAGELQKRVPLEGKYRSLEKITVTDAGEYVGFDGKQQKVYKWSPSGELVGVFGTSGKGRGKFGRLCDLMLDEAGNVLTLDRSNLEIQAFAFESPAIPASGRTPAPLYAIAYDAAHPVELEPVSILEDGLVLFDKVSKKVHIRRGDAEQIVSHADFRAVTAAYLGPERLYFFDRAQHKVYAFRADTLASEFQFGGRGRSDGCLDDVTRILPGHEKTLYLADMGATKVQVFSRDGIFSMRFGRAGEEKPHDIGRLQDIAWYGKLLAVLDSGRNLVHLFNRDGEFVRNIDLQLPTERVELAAIGTDVNGFVFVLDRRNARVYAFDENGRLTFRFGSYGKRPLDWYRAESFLVGTNGELRLFDRAREPRVLTYALRTPGPLARIAQAVETGDWRTTKELLDPYLDRPETPGYAEAIQWALKADVGMEEDFLTDAQTVQAYASLEQALKEAPENTDVRLTLIESFMDNGRLKEALSLLYEGQKLSSDPRYTTLQAAYRKEMEEAGLAEPIVAIEACKVPVIFAALYQNYYDRPVIELTLANSGAKPAPAGKALFFAKAVMDNPTETPIPGIDPFSATTVRLRATLNRGALTFVEATRLSAQLEVQLGDLDSQIRLEKNVSFELMGRNSIDWEQESMIACFITPKDPDVQVFARQAMKMAGSQTIQAELDTHLYQAVTLFDAMQSVGIYYLPDPRQPFAFSRFSGQGVVDYLQYPRETLLRQSGDCDDLSVLYASLLEGAGIPTMLITSPGHIFAAFALKSGKKSVDALGLSPDLLIRHEGDYYVPVETTLLGGPFISSWRVAAKTIAEHQPRGRIGFIDVKKAWADYKTVSLPPQDQQVPLPTTNVLEMLLTRELGALNLKQVEKRLAIYKQWLANDPENLKLLFYLTRAYGEVGLFDIAKEYANRAKGVAPNSAEVYQVLGNLDYMQNQYAAATAWYLQADKIEHTAAIQVNLALSNLKDGKLVLARNAYKEAKTLQPDLVANYPELGQLLE